LTASTFYYVSISLFFINNSNNRTAWYCAVERRRWRGDGRTDRWEFHTSPASLVRWSGGRNNAQVIRQLI